MTACPCVGWTESDGGDVEGSRRRVPRFRWAYADDTPVSVEQYATPKSRRHAARRASRAPNQWLQAAFSAAGLQSKVRIKGVRFQTLVRTRISSNVSLARIPPLQSTVFSRGGCRGGLDVIVWTHSKRC